MPPLRPPTPGPAPNDDLRAPDDEDRLEDLAPWPSGPDAEDDLWPPEQDEAALPPGGALDVWELRDDAEVDPPLELEGPGTELPLAEAEPADPAVWTDHEDEARLLPAGRVLVGAREWCTLPDLLRGALEVTFSPWAPASVLLGRLEPLAPGRAWLTLAGERVEVQGFVDDRGGLLVETRIGLAGHCWSARFQVRDEAGPAPVVLGRDVLGARVLIDPSAEFLHRGGRP